MFILPISSNYNNLPILKSFNKKTRDFDLNNNTKSLATDVFTNNVSFKANTSAGGPLKRLRNIICPYFGVEMISGSELKKIEDKLDQCKNVRDVVNSLKKYKKNMLKTERKMFSRFANMAQVHPDMKLQDCLKMWYGEAITKLKLEEFNVLDDVDKISLGLSPENALNVHAKTTRCREVILADNKEDTFKRKTLLDSLEEILPKSGEKRVYEKLKDRAIYLPTSGTSENAFVVKYANREQPEIAKRLIRTSVATIEHIKPDSKEGENSIANFMLTSAGANNMRSNMPLPKFIEMFPFIPENCQKYINQIIDIIHKGWLKGNETYPYKVKKTLEKESRGAINLDLSNYKYTKKEANEAVYKYYHRDYVEN